ncbi:hypothetical protein [Rhizobacter sp. Root1221]|uniref:hypothetical protein n=1 Tax=Rhizobacter sp. Root1221 TaxID=1736433 RepID=UPI00071422D5|nr:hypothetical protein [Rhizobacter sp. Root1221]KQV78299.1 hypothetical protein ASC87_11930 [Rhizobacter sp. Root1221]
MLLDVSHLPPEHGWLTVTFITSDSTVVVDASDALNNPIQDLLAALDAVSRGQPSSVRWFLEPGAYVLDLEPSGQEVMLRLTLCRDSLEGNDGVRKLDLSGPRGAILAPICRLLRNIEAGNYPTSTWPHSNLGGLEIIEHRLGLD